MALRSSRPPRFSGAGEDEAQVAVHERERLERGERILARLDRAHEERVRRTVSEPAPSGLKIGSTP